MSDGCAIGAGRGVFRWMGWILTHLLLAEEAGEQAGDRETHDVWLVERSRGVVDGRTEELRPCRGGGHWACGPSSTNVEGDYSGPFSSLVHETWQPGCALLAGRSCPAWCALSRVPPRRPFLTRPAVLVHCTRAGPNFQCSRCQGPPRDRPGNAERGTHRACDPFCYQCISAQKSARSSET